MYNQQRFLPQTYNQQYNPLPNGMMNNRSNFVNRSIPNVNINRSLNTNNNYNRFQNNNNPQVRYNYNNNYNVDYNNSYNNDYNNSYNNDYSNSYNNDYTNKYNTNSSYNNKYNNNSYNNDYNKSYNNNNYNNNYRNNNYNNSARYNYQINQNNLHNRGENGLENGIPNSQRQKYNQNNINNNFRYNNQQKQIQNQYKNQNNINNINNYNFNKNNYINQNNQNAQNIINANGGNTYIENGLSEEKKEEEKEKKENKIDLTRDELILDYENNLRKEVEKSSPLISEDFKINILIDEYKSNEEYLKSIQNITKKYKYIRKVIRDGNCFYRSYIFRLFEHICIKNDKILFEKIKQKIIDSKELTEKNGYDWAVVEDFYNLFLKEFTDCFNSLSFQYTVRDYLDTLFCEREKGNYLIYFIRFCIAAYLKENKESYQMYIEGDFDEWVRKEVEAIDHEADQIQIMACVNYFDIGVKIEYLNKNKSEVVKLPYDKPDNQFFIFLLFTPGHYDILYP